MAKYNILNRSIIEVTGADRKAFLQGLITNNIEKVSSSQSIYALMLTPQGKFLYDFFISEKADSLFIDIEKNSVENALKRLSMYKLKSAVELKTLSAYSVLFIFENHQKLNGTEAIITSDPRLKTATRVIIETSEIENFAKNNGLDKSSDTEYETFRIENLLPETGKELFSEKSFPLQNNMEELNAIDFNKGCYVGQEVTARSKYRGNITKKLIPVNLTGSANSGEAIKLGEKTIGELRSISGNKAIAQVDISELENNKEFSSSSAIITLL